MEETLRTATAMHQSGQLEFALQLYREVLTQNPQHAESWRDMAAVLQGLQRPTEAADALRNYVTLQPTADAHTRLANQLRQLSLLDEALQHYRQAAELAPHDALVQGNLGQVFLALQRPSEAIGPCEQATRLQPHNPTLHLILGDARRRAEHYPLAEEAYRAVLKLNPNLAPAYVGMGLLFRSQRRLYEVFTLLAASPGTPA